MGRKHSSKKTHKKKYPEVETYIGTMELTRSGMGFVVVEGLESDVLVRPNDFNSALHGDKVRVQLQARREGKRVQGVVQEVIERKQTEFIGRLEMNKGYAFFVA